jgi:hypothetical protein
MIETTLALIAMGIIIIICGAKLWNIVNNLEVYPKQLIIIGLILAIFCWGIYFTASMSALNQEQIITSETDTFVSTNNNYRTLFNFFPIINILLMAIGVLTAIEGVISIKDIINPKQFKQQYGYTPRPPSQEYKPNWK